MKAYNPRYQSKTKRAFSFGLAEVKDLLLAWLVLGLIFAWVMTESLSLTALGVSLLTVGVGFLLHELAHKFVAQHYGCHAEFHADKKMLLFAALLALVTGFIFAAPGAVVIRGVKSVKHFGKIAAAGPLTNIGLALIFAFIPGVIGNFGYLINVWLALFNMIPLGPLDGKKIMAWDKVVYWIITLGAAALLVGYYVLL